MRFALLIIMLVLTLHTSNAQDTSVSIRAAQVFYSNASNYEEFEREIVSMKNFGFNVMIFRVFGNEGDRIYKFVKPKSKVGVYLIQIMRP